MRKYSLKSTSAARIDYGTELSAGLRGFWETAPLAAELQGRVRAVFPQDRAQQDAVFPVVNGGRVVGADRDDPAVASEPAVPEAPVA